MGTGTMLVGWILAVILGVGAQVHGAEECSAALEPAPGCEASHVVGPASLLASIGLFVLWRRSAEPPERRRAHVLWVLAVVVALVPLIWIWVADVTA